MSKITVIYHSADYDGIFCREVAKKFLGEKDVNYIGWNFGDAPLEIPNTAIYVMDLPLDKVFGFEYKKGDKVPPQHPSGLVWIDHHKTSIETHPESIPGYRIDGVAACRLAWQWFTIADGNTPRTGAEIGVPIRPAGLLPMIQHFKNREVNEPLSVRLAGEYDIWDKRDPNAETFQYGIRVAECPDIFRDILEVSPNGENATMFVVGQGLVAQAYARKVDASICNHSTWLTQWEGLKFLCVNHARFNSLLFAAKDVPETGHDALLGFRFDGKSWMVSLYHANHRKDLDLSVIAKKHGGGGHRGACGFTCKELPKELLA